MILKQMNEYFIQHKLIIMDFFEQYIKLFLNFHNMLLFQANVYLNNQLISYGYFYKSLIAFIVFDYFQNYFNY